MEVIKLKDINKKYGKGESQEHVLKDINLSINKGDMVAIMGPSGSGKTSLLNILGLMDKQSSGRYELYGEYILNKSEKELASLRNEKIGFVFQNFNLINEYNLIENVIIPLSYSKNKRSMKERAISKLEEVGLKNYIKKKVNELSGGQKQRVAIARALVNEPEIILADEPTGALDEKNGNSIMEILKDINKKGKTVIIITHDINIANKCKNIIEIKDGKLYEKVNDLVFM